MMHAIAATANATLVLFSCLLLTTSSAQPASNISSCLLSNGVRNFSLPESPSYATLLNSSIQNLRFALPNVSKPAAVVIPSSKVDLQRAILCARDSSLAIRVRSGGHSYEGLSYTTENHVSFVVVDLMNLNRVQVDMVSNTAWVESGATLGELYHAIGQSNMSLAFPAGSCSTVGIGGIVSGGGFGLISRKFALAADNVLDAILIDSNGNALDRGSMGGDVFWAIRGGGGGSWGVVYAWKLRLVHVPHNITVFSLGRTGTVKHIAKLMHKWQFVGPYLPDEFYLSIYIPTGTSNGNVSMSFTGQVLGPKQYAMSVLHHTFPELGLAESDLSEMSWIESIAKFAGLSSVDDLSHRWLGAKQYSKSKSDYVRSPISMQGTINIIKYLSNGPQGSIQLDPYDGAMARIESSKIPFPHRAGNLYSIQYGVSWHALDNGQAEKYIGWLRSFYAYMAPYVSKNPRAAYVNYLDLDLGTNNWMNATNGTSNGSVIHARSWGRSYFLKNFDRLARAKAKIDPTNVFNNAQSIPPLQY
ncbi:reticuline oxidase-like [Oryza brachyantha]|uniref:FAD-binding PCMH-type domain-containing protein n=1 Tax=Oryza brachyantha TaxID=4533 RepID=J3MQJ7_ORYBR|nr:reticuline oxidase-like [Oryza brachyantha]